MIDYDKALLESVSAHRGRLSAAFVHGAQEKRRPVNTNVRRLMGSVILAAVACAGCLGTGFVLNVIKTQKESTAITAYRQAIASNPIPAGDGLTKDETSGYLVNDVTGTIIDPRTGFPINPVTGYATDPQGRTVDPRTGWFVNPETGNFTDPASGLTIDPETLTVVETPTDESSR